LAHARESMEQIHRLQKHVLYYYKRSICTKFEIGDLGTAYQRLSYFHHGRQCPWQALMDGRKAMSECKEGDEIYTVMLGQVRRLHQNQFL
jgi:hypothetical protein